jgi:hypothetical protein
MKLASVRNVGLILPLVLGGDVLIRVVVSTSPAIDLMVFCLVIFLTVSFVADGSKLSCRTGIPPVQIKSEQEELARVIRVYFSRHQKPK